jgi:hypothetical protein
MHVYAWSFSKAEAITSFYQNYCFIFKNWDMKGEIATCLYHTMHVTKIEIFGTWIIELGVSSLWSSIMSCTHPPALHFTFNYIVYGFEGKAREMKWPFSQIYYAQICLTVISDCV